MFLRGLVRQLGRLGAFATGAIVGQRLFGTRAGVGSAAAEIARTEIDSIGMAIVGRNDARIGRFIVQTLVASNPRRVPRVPLRRRPPNAVIGRARFA